MSKLIDLTNQKFGKLTVLHKDTERITKNGSYWICQCECGKTKSIKSSSLRRGEILSCGCLRNQRVQEIKYQQSLDMIEKTFGKLTVIERSERKGNSGEIYWICLCDCGNLTEVRGQDLKRNDGNQTISCGCFHRSIGATKILNCLTDNNIDFIEEYTFIDLPKSRFDFAIIENKQVVRLVEFDGEQHFKNIEKWGGLELQQKRDNIKNQYALKNNIPLIRIPYWERNNITLEIIMEDKYRVVE